MLSRRNISTMKKKKKNKKCVRGKRTQQRPRWEWWNPVAGERRILQRQGWQRRPRWRQRNDNDEDGRNGGGGDGETRRGPDSRTLTSCLWQDGWWLVGWLASLSVGLAGPYPRYMCQCPVRAAAYTHPPRFASVSRAPFTLIPARLTEACYSFSR